MHLLAFAEVVAVQLERLRAIGDDREFRLVVQTQHLAAMRIGAVPVPISTTGSPFDLFCAPSPPPAASRGSVTQPHNRASVDVHTEHPGAGRRDVLVVLGRRLAPRGTKRSVKRLLVREAEGRDPVVRQVAAVNGSSSDVRSGSSQTGPQPASGGSPSRTTRHVAAGRKNSADSASNRGASAR